METSKALLLALLILAALLLLFYPKNIYVEGSLVGDPPSVFNVKNGGVSTYFRVKAPLHGLVVIYSFSELEKYSPNHYALFIIGPDREVAPSGELENWVRRGGTLIIMDESDNTRSLVRAFGVEYGSLEREIKLGNCTFNGRVLIVLFNVYRDLKPVHGGCTVICRVRNDTVALETRYGSGRVYVVGDSSLVINELYIKNQNIWDNPLFVDEMIGDRKILVYEGARNYTHETVYGTGKILSGIADLLRDSASSVFNDTTILVASKISGIIIAATIFLFITIGFPESINSWFNRRS